MRSRVSPDAISQSISSIRSWKFLGILVNARFGSSEKSHIGVVVVVVVVLVVVVVAVAAVAVEV